MPCSSSGWGRSSPPASSSAADVELLLQLGLGFSVALQPINLLSRGDFTFFFTRPISAACLLTALFLLVSPLIPALGKKREQIAVEEVS